MPKDHPRYQEGIVGTWELVWKDLQGNPTIDATQRASKNAVGALVPPETPESIPTHAIGWKIDLKKTVESPYLDDRGQPGWSTYPKNHDSKPVFTGREYPISLPKVAATIRNIQKEAGAWAHSEPDMSLKILQSNPEKYDTYLLTNIAHHLEKWLRKGPGFGTYDTQTEISLEVHDKIWGESQPWVRIRQWDRSYKIVPSNAYSRDKWRHAWSIHIDTSNSDTRDLSRAQNFKLLPVWDNFFEAKICLDTTHYTPLSAENRALLESIVKLLNSLT